LAVSAKNMVSSYWQYYRMHLWQSGLEIKYYSAIVENVLTALIKALGLPPHGEGVRALFIACRSY